MGLGTGQRMLGLTVTELANYAFKSVKELIHDDESREAIEAWLYPPQRPRELAGLPLPSWWSEP